MEGFLGIGGNELLLILLFAFLIFGPDKLPDIARTIGRAIAKFRDAQNEVNEVIRQEVYDPATDADNPFQKVTERAADLNKKATDPGATESFAERKARYDKIRAERKAKEEAAEKAAAGATSAASAKGSSGSAADVAPASDDVDIDELLGVAKPAPAAAGKPAAEGGDA